MSGAAAVQAAPPPQPPPPQGQTWGHSPPYREARYRDDRHRDGDHRYKKKKRDSIFDIFD